MVIDVPEDIYVRQQNNYLSFNVFETWRPPNVIANYNADY